MSQQQMQGKIATRTAVLVFCKDMASPMVLYFDNAQKIYEDLRTLINSTEVKLVEFEPVGPIKKATILSDRIVGVALQEEKYIVQE
ncbi:MAG: hypothetical protein IKU37_00385 [Candidatus Gastranaerophilales bacterium]|nr:hypothetical protein [Candidatus Gastranaerophilales bacterium]